MYKFENSFNKKKNIKFGKRTSVIPIGTSAIVYWIIFHELVNYFWIGEYYITYINGENIVNLKVSMK